MVYYLHYRPECSEVADIDFCFFASYMSSILNPHTLLRGPCGPQKTFPAAPTLVIGISNNKKLSLAFTLLKNMFPFLHKIAHEQLISNTWKWTIVLILLNQKGNIFFGCWVSRRPHRTKLVTFFCKSVWGLIKRHLVILPFV